MTESIGRKEAKSQEQRGIGHLPVRILELETTSIAPEREKAKTEWIRNTWGELILNSVPGDVSTILGYKRAGNSEFHNTVYMKFLAASRAPTTFCFAYEEVFFFDSPVSSGRWPLSSDRGTPSGSLLLVEEARPAASRASNSSSKMHAPARMKRSARLKTGADSTT